MNARQNTDPMASLLLKQLRMGDRLFAVVDAARDRYLAKTAQTRFGQNIRWLFGDDVSNHMADVAPYLIPIDTRVRNAEKTYLDLWVEKIGTSAGILIATMRDRDALWQHLRTVFQVTDEDRRGYYFRFYDPRVLRSFLPACSAGEAQQFFGPIGRIMVESETPSRMLTCEPGPQGVAITEWNLSGNGHSGDQTRRRR